MTNTMGNLFDEVEAGLIAQFKAITPEQFAAEEQRRKAVAEYDAKHTAIETDEDRANTDEYPVDEDER
tara:strand:+ start:807 stop:1010 length:204 start_codon:yes stop_codon:yes gene_type:complete